MDHHDRIVAPARRGPGRGFDDPTLYAFLRHAVYAVAFLFGAFVPARGQRAMPSLDQAMELAATASIARNSVANLHARGDSLWVGPLLNFTADGGNSWFQADADSVVRGLGRVFSIDQEGPEIWVGLGFSREVIIDGRKQFIPTAGGFVTSSDGGLTWTYRFPPLDVPGDTLITYGISTLRALDVIVPEQSPPYDIDFDPASGTVWTAGWASGLRRSVDGGITWRRVVLPPDTLSELRPDRPYDFVYSPRQTQGSQNLNFAAFSVLVDETGTVWAGTAGGLNRSEDGIAWRRYAASDLTSPVLGNWIISIEEQPLPGRNPVWFSTWRAEGPAERFGVMVTRDGGASFEAFLTGERVYDFAFAGETVYVAGDNGLFISDDGGASWRSIHRFVDAASPDREIRPGAQAFSVATTRSGLWVGTEDGLAYSENGGSTWRIIRTEVPLTPAEPTEDIPAVETYAYPNPFSPGADGVVRIRYELDEDQTVTVRLFDFRQHLVRILIDGDVRAAGIREEMWDGSDERGLRLPNGPYFYVVETNAGNAWGKILLLR